MSKPRKVQLLALKKIKVLEEIIQPGMTLVGEPIQADCWEYFEDRPRKVPKKAYHSLVLSASAYAHDFHLIDAVVFGPVRMVVIDKTNDNWGQDYLNYRADYSVECSFWSLDKK